MSAICRNVAVLWLVALCLLGGQVAMADVPTATVKSVSGRVLSSSDNKPINALVYVNGKSVFANKTTGAFTLVGNPLAPPLSVGQTLSLQVVATGYAPIVKVLTVTSTQLTSGKFSGLKITMKPVAPGKALTVAKTFKAAPEKGYFVVSGTVKSGSTPVCAVVWANGSAMLSCKKDAVGKFSLRGKLGSTGKVTLKVFPVSSTYRTYTYTTPDTDKDGTADFMDRDDDNDGIEDGLDACPIDPNPNCKLPDTVTINGKKWYQPSLFNYITWNEIAAACPGGKCKGTLRGYDMNGWTWASLGDVRKLFKFLSPTCVLSISDSTCDTYLFREPGHPSHIVCSPICSYHGIRDSFGRRSDDPHVPFGYLYLEVEAWTSSDCSVVLGNCEAGDAISFHIRIQDYFEPQGFEDDPWNVSEFYYDYLSHKTDTGWGGAGQEDRPYGGWFYRNP